MNKIVKKYTNWFVKQFVSNTKKSVFKTWLVSLVRLMAKQQWFMPFLSRYVVSEITMLTPIKTSNNKLRLLVLNEERYQADLSVLGEHPDIELLSLPSKVHGLINSIWVSKIREILRHEPQLFYAGTDTRVIEVREKLVSMLQSLQIQLKKRLGIDGIVTCTFYYKQDKDWAIASEKIHLPFFVLHKENMKDPVTHEESIPRYRSMNFSFDGARIFLFNELEKKVLMHSIDGIDESKISVTGGLRMDRIHQRLEHGSVINTKRQIVLFSFHHCVGMLQIPNLNGFFNPDRDKGFIDYFDLVHGMVAKFAYENPDVNVVIKPKWMQGWSEEIEMAIKRITGMEAKSIDNLKITVDTPAQELIEQSKVIIGINSTTLLESKLYGRRVIMPLFAEATEKYFDKHVYFHDYLDTFNTPRTPEDLLTAIDEELSEKAPERDMSEEMIKDYLGFFDGRIAQRIVEQMRKDVNEIANSL